MLEIRLFGPLRLASEGVPLTLVALPRTMPLFAYLLLHRDEAVNRGRLAYTLWPDVREEESRANLRRHLHELVTALPEAPAERPWLLRLPGALRWNPAADYWLDVAAFEDMLGRPGELAAAVALYTDDLLPELDDAWVVAERERLRRLVVAGLRRLIEGAAGSSPADGIMHAERLYEMEPTNEEVVRLIMTARADAGDRSGALEIYQALRRRLAGRLGLAPLTETEALAVAISLGERPGSGAAGGAPSSPPPPLRAATAPPGRVGDDDGRSLGDARAQLVVPGSAATPVLPSSRAPLGSVAGAAAAPARARTNLPAALTSFIGRQAEVEALCGWLSDPSSPHRLITLTGPGGTGKTRLGREVAHRLHLETPALFPDGLWEVDLAALNDAELVPSAIADTLGIAIDGRRSRLDDLLEALAARRLLLLLDNFEQVAGAAPAVARLLQAAPGLRILVTSRTVLHVYGEQEFPLRPLALPGAGAIIDGELPEVEAVALFVERAKAVNPGFRLTPDNAAQVAEICARLDGLPLAIELAAAYGRLFTPAALLGRLIERPFFAGDLPARGADRPVRHQTLRQAMDWGFRLLDEDEQALFCRLAVFAASFSLEAAEAVATAEGGDAAALLGGIADLESKSMVLPAAPLADGAPRFRMLSTLREYGLARLEKRQDADAVRHRHAAYYLGLAAAAATGLRGAQAGHWLMRLDAETDDVRAALDWLSATGRTEDGLLLLTRVEQHWNARGYLAEGRRRLGVLLGQASAPATTARIAALRMGARLANRQGDTPTCQALCHEAVALARELGNDTELARSLAIQASFCESGEAAQALLDESLALLREAGDQSGISDVYLSLGVNAYFAQDYLAARAYLEQSLTIRRAIGEIGRTDQLLNNLGLVAYALEDLPAALELHQEALAIRRASGSKPGVSQSLLNTAVVLAHIGRGEEAEALIRESLAMLWELGSKIAMVEALEWLAVLAGGKAQPQRAVTLFGAASSLREMLGVALDPAFETEHAWALAAARGAIGAADADAAWAAGRSYTLEAAVRFGLAREGHEGLSHAGGPSQTNPRR